MKKEDLKVGDRIEDFSTMQEGKATVTEITERGFKYKLDNLKVAHPRLGIMWDEGEAYLDDEYLQKSCHWKKIDELL
jgi:hypothetical protein